MPSRHRSSAAPSPRGSVARDRCQLLVGAGAGAAALPTPMAETTW